MSDFILYHRCFKVNRYHLYKGDNFYYLFSNMNPFKGVYVWYMKKSLIPVGDSNPLKESFTKIMNLTPVWDIVPF